MTREILLSGQNPERLFAIVDDGDFELVAVHRWYAHRAKGSLTVYAKATKRPTIYLHRLVMGAKAGEIIDHIDGNGLNCTRQNLRQVTHSENVLQGNIRRAFDEWEGRL